jgi:hypothetical protein
MSTSIGAADAPRIRTAHPYRDLDVVDARAPRFNQATVGVVSLIAVLTGWWILLGVLAAQLAIGLRFGRQYCLPCLFYFEVVQPRVGEGPIEDSRPPKFANQVGFVFLSTATLAHVVGLPLLGNALGLIVAALALLAAVTGLCVGCEMYKIGARLRGIRGRSIDRVDLAELGAPADAGELVVAFSHPLCTDCRETLAELSGGPVSLVTIDVRERPDLARRYGIALVPTVLRVNGDGRVVAQEAG